LSLSGKSEIISPRKNNSFDKSERIKSKKLIDNLFTDGKSINTPHLKLLWLPVPASDSPAKIGFAVSSKVFRKAVDRNKLKRLLRESFRLNKKRVYDHLSANKSSATFMLIFTGKKLVSHKEIDDEIIQLLTRFIKDNETFIPNS